MKLIKKRSKVESRCKGCYFNDDDKYCNYTEELADNKLCVSSGRVPNWLRYYIFVEKKEVKK